MPPSKYNLARSANTRFFTQPLSKECSAAAGGKTLFAALRAKVCFEGLCKKSFAAFCGRIFFCETHHFHDFAKRNRENDVSHKI